VRWGPEWRGVQGDRGAVDVAGGAEKVDGAAYAVGPWKFVIDAEALRCGLRAMVMEITRRRSGPDRLRLASVAVD
jgi:hypothetical protein